MASAEEEACASLGMHAKIAREKIKTPRTAVALFGPHQPEEAVVVLEATMVVSKTIVSPCQLMMTAGDDGVGTGFKTTKARGLFAPLETALETEFM